MAAIVAGGRCLALLEGWQDATVSRVNEDGTFTITPDQPAMRIMPRWYGLTRLELSVDDLGTWTRVAPALADPDGFGAEAFHRALVRAGVRIELGPVVAHWDEAVAELFGLPPGAKVELEQAWRVLRRAGAVAKRVAEGIPPGDRWFRMYWNQTRMGGRDPDDVGYAVGIDDALAALGLADAEEDPGAVALDGVPADLAASARRRGAVHALYACHPNSPEPRDPSEWVVEGGLIRFMEAHQGDFGWAARVDSGEVHMVWTDEQGSPRSLPQAPSFAFFAWDLAQTGASWYAEHAHERAAGLRPTERGWVRDGPIPP